MSIFTIQLTKSYMYITIIYAKTKIKKYDKINKGDANENRISNRRWRNEGPL